MLCSSLHPAHRWISRTFHPNNHRKQKLRAPFFSIPTCVDFRYFQVLQQFLPPSFHPFHFPSTSSQSFPFPTWSAKTENSYHRSSFSLFACERREGKCAAVDKDFENTSNWEGEERENFLFTTWCSINKELLHFVAAKPSWSQGTSSVNPRN